ncbi:hypothetical protein [Selenomonas sp.]|uniref:hypothetical protein n=1 Tax=Selenomonas sp. TaxID=2053611 RepID=UPI0025FBFB66|nr:hypothetical protein [Selenomonas sp.]MCI6283179.1 hypothetical protein [Selenomonas sp.]
MAQDRPNGRSEFDETQVLGKPLQSQKRQGQTPALDDTQSIPTLDDAVMQHPRRRTGVRELAPLDAPAADTAGQGTAGGAGSTAPPFWTKSRKRNAILAGGFVFALLLGFILAGYTQQSTERAENERMHQEQQLQSQQAQLAKDTKALEEKKAQLEQEKRELEKQRQQAAQQAARAQGRNEQIANDKSSGLGKLLDKVTGKEKKQQQAQAANDAAAAAAQTDAANIDQSIENAQQMLDDVNAKLDTAKAAGQEASAALEKAQTVYDENRDTIDTIVSYAQTGVRMLGSLLFQ